MVLFAALFLAPGYVAAWGFDLFDFRRRMPAVRFVIGTVTSFAITPIAAFLVYHFASAVVALLLAGVAALACVVIWLQASHPATPVGARRLQTLALWIAGAWVVGLLLSLTDIQWADRLYNNSVAYDLTTRVAIIHSITRSGVPPINASYYPGHPVLMTFVYYFWYIPCSLVDQLGGPLVDAHAAMIASSAWCGLGLMSVVALYLRLRNRVAGPAAWSKALMGCGLLLVSGLDAIMILVRTGILVPYHGDIEHWNEQITAWVGSLSWVPHHVAALVACTAGTLLLHWLRGQPFRRQLGPAIIAGLAFASGFGLSVYVTLVFVLFWAIWMLVLFLQGERQTGLLMLGIGLIALVAAAPFMLGLLRGNPGGGGATALPLKLEVRGFLPAYPFIANYPAWVVQLIYALLLPVNYLMELGFFFVAALFWAEAHGQGRWKEDPFQLAEVILLVVTVLIASFVRATVIDNNDFGWRAWLPGQFVLLVWGTDVLARYFPNGLLGSHFDSARAQRLALQLRGLLLIGLLTTVVDVVSLRIWPILEDTGIGGSVLLQCLDLQQGRRTFAARQAYDFVNAHTPLQAVIEENPADILSKPLGLYADRQIAISAHTAYGVTAEDLIQRARAILPLYQASSWSQIDALCSQNSIDVLVVRDQDPIWESLPVLETQRKPLYQNGYYAVLQCGPTAHP